MELSLTQQAFIFNESDITHPYKVCAPKFSIIPLRFQTDFEAFECMSELKKKGHAAVMTKVDVRLEKCKIIKCIDAKEKKVRKRKE